jgi:two-component system LytT family sensor kinase
VTPEQVVQILHGVGFLTGVALYAMLLSMVLPSVRRPGFAFPADAPAIVTAALGLIWNVGALALVTGVHAPPASMAFAYAALGLLPAVFVQVAVRSWRGPSGPRTVDRWISRLAYVMGGGAALLQLVEAAVWGDTPSTLAFRVLALGFVFLVPLMVAAAPAEARRRGGALWMLAVAVFAISAWHLGQHHPGEEGWSAVVLGHHASIPMALAILWLDFRFALADIFLKRALALLVLVGGIVALYVGLTGPYLVHRGQGGGAEPSWVVVVLALWAGTALAYPVIRRGAVWFVDSVLLKRPDAAALRAELARDLGMSATAPEALDLACRVVGPALNASVSRFEAAASPLSPGQDLVAVEVLAAETAVTVVVPTVEAPHYALRFESIGGGRRILSDDVAFLESVAVMTARRLDALRWLHERCERDLREEEIAKLATEAELRALQAQLNPHFLFNALNTLGYLMKAAPDRARHTLFDLTKLLRAVLKRSGGGVTTLGQELDLVEAYLSIERARFEDRVRLRLEVPPALRGLLVPPLVVQPLVENAIKHGIGPRRYGGEIAIRAHLESMNARPRVLVIEVSDSGIGVSEAALRLGRSRGLGLANIEKRLKAHYGDEATLSLVSRVDEGTCVTLRVPAAVPPRTATLPSFVAAGRA